MNLFGSAAVQKFGCLAKLGACVMASEVCWFGFEGGLLGAAWVLEGSGVYV